MTLQQFRVLAVLVAALVALLSWPESLPVVLGAAALIAAGVAGWALGRKAAHRLSDR